MGAVYDMYGVVAARLRFRRLRYAFFDLLYWLLCIPIVFRILYLNNSGELRTYVFLGIGIGVCLHLLLFSSFVKSVTRIVIRILEWCWSALRWTVRIFLVRPVQWLYKLLVFVAGIGFKVATVIGRLVLKCLYPFAGLYRAIAVRLAQPLRRLAGRTIVPVRNWARRQLDRFRRKRPPDAPPPNLPPGQPPEGE